MARYGNGPYGGQPGHRGRDWKKIAIIGGVALVAIVIVAMAVGGSGGRSADPAALASASPTPSAAESETVVTPAPTRREPAPASTTEAPSTSATERDAPPATATVPDVVGKDLQTAQEELFPPLRSTSVDATGQGRVQLLDSNWVVVRQEPAAGTTVPVFTDIKLFVVKPGESAR